MADEANSGRVLRFGVFEADLASGELRKQGRRLRLQEQPFRILTLLLDRPGQVVSRDEIRAALWAADTFVDFNHGLNKAMNRLRDALGDSADSPRFIETIPKRGYRFIAPVEALQTASDPAVSHESVNPPLAAVVRATSRGKAWFALAAGLVAAGGVATVLYIQRTPALTERDTVVLADFENRTGDAAFDDVLKQALSIALQDSLRIVTVPDQRIVDTLRLMHRDPNQQLTLELARDVCQRAGSKAVLGGYVATLGSEYVIGIVAMNCSNGETLAQEQVRVTGDAERASEVCEAWIQPFSRERTARNRLGAAYRQLGRFERALAEYQTARLVGGDHPIDRRDMALTYLQLGRVSEAAPIVRQALEQNPDDRRFRVLDYLINVLNGNDATLDQLAEWARRSINAEELLALHSNTEASLGHLAKARDLTRQAVASARQHDLRGRAGLWLAQSGLREALFDNAEAASRDTAAALDLSSGWDTRIIAAAALARVGDLAKAESLLEPLKRELPSNTLLQKYWLPAVEADIALHRGDTARAVSRLENARGFELAAASTTAPALYPPYIRGLAYLSARQGAPAAREFQNILDHRGLVGNHPLLVFARLGLARAHMLAGDVVKARVEYQAVLTRWKDADGNFAMLKDVRVEAR